MNTKTPTLSPGSVVVNPDGERFHCVAMSDTGVVTLRDGSGATQATSTTEVVHGGWSLVDWNPPPTPGPDEAWQRIRSKAKREEIRDLGHHIEDVLSGCPAGCDRHDENPGRCYDPSEPRRTLDERKITEMRNAGWKMSVSNFERKRTAYAADGYVGLLPKRYRAAEPMLRNAPEGLESVMRQVMAEAKTDSTKTAKTRIQQVRERFQETMGEPLKTHRSTLYRYFDLLDQDRMLSADAKTRGTFAQPNKPFVTRSAHRPGEVVELDATPLDFLVEVGDPDADGSERGERRRLKMIAAIDVCTRLLLAWVIVDAKEVSSQHVAVLFARMLDPSGYLQRMRTPEFDAMLQEELGDQHPAEFLPTVVPERVVIDHGLAFKNAGIERMCRRIGIDIQMARKAKGQDKPYVERAIKTVNLDAGQQLPGYVGRHAAHRGKDADSKQQRLLTQFEAEQVLTYWVLTEYHRRPHEGLRDPQDTQRKLSPLQRYHSAVAMCGAVPMPLPSEFSKALLPAQVRTVRRDGIQIAYRKYHPVEQRDRERYRDLCEQVDTDPQGNAKSRWWLVHQDPVDVRVVYVYDDVEDRYLEFEFEHSDKVGGCLTADTWVQAREVVERRGGDSTDAASVTRAADRLMASTVNSATSPSSDADIDDVPESSGAAISTTSKRKRSATGSTQRQRRKTVVDH